MKKNTVEPNRTEPQHFIRLEKLVANDGVDNACRFYYYVFRIYTE